MYPFSPELPSHPGCHITLRRILCAIQYHCIMELFKRTHLLYLKWIFSKCVHVVSWMTLPETSHKTPLIDVWFLHFPKIWSFIYFFNIIYLFGFPGGTSGKEPACQCRRWKRHRFDPWVGKIPWRRVWKPTSILLPGEFHWQRSLAGYSSLDRKE